MISHTSKFVGEGLTYDDVLLIPAYSEILLSEIPQEKLELLLLVIVAGIMQRTRIIIWLTTRIIYLLMELMPLMPGS